MGTSMTVTEFLGGGDGGGRAAVLGAAVSGAVVGVLAVGDGEFSGVRFTVPEGYVARELRGVKMRTVAGVFDEFAAAFQFAYYFGENKDAFDECLRDLDDFVGRAPGYVAVIRDGAQLLADEPEELDWFDAAVTDAARHWAARGVAFRVVLQDRPAGVQAATLTLV
ncbi:hypothetical protein CRH09_06285 [Nocardia terpenica]|uniref:Barstar (barnase inhibitor) domain-containing protein n=1 Tax=Nocardia terpenica TaxID=455432 RepID=A0A291REZ3_9NOCA|nr:hypothetical protein CRH09_06285 [Nocardia terpenica]